MNIFAKALAEADSREQANFFNEFSRALILACGDGDHRQVCYFSEELDSNARKLIKDLAEFISLHEESRPKIERTLSELRQQQYELERQIADLKEQQNETSNR